MKQDMAQRLVGKPKQSQADREALKAKKMRIKDKWETNNMGDFQNLFPLRRGVTADIDRLQDKYDLIFRKSKEVYEDSSQIQNNKRFLRKDEKYLPKDIDDKKDKDANKELTGIKKKKSQNMTTNIDVMSSITLAQQGKRQTSKNINTFGLPPSGNTASKATSHTLDQRASISNRQLQNYCEKKPIS